MENSTELMDESLFRQVFYNYSKKLYYYILSKTNSQHLANEVTQITFIKLWKYRQNLNREVSISTQIFQIAKTTLIDEQRKEGRLQLNLKKLIIKQNLFDSNNGDNTYNKLNLKDTQRMFNDALEQLPPTRRKVLQLSRNEELTHKEISDKLSISVKTVEKHIQLALRAIKPILKEI
ncbi:sigma-70 family RNA polymerase sigma factor [Niabella sp. W65]|jgi:RNA polymerase sigma-70 factor (ECF subfamily)|nr:sigma-70 family RNA polymerase sigma factor [Niabella sp. W65]MCH7363367.1 sigma-70 family RNA polymerase sigma factor [Niabella sp. W65]ULT39292.1 sigma-70 family RNA polymerase sigma factor [Niabella sp. I65]